MRLPLCMLALALSAWAADIDVPQPVDVAIDSPDQAAQAPADAAKPADATPPAPPPKYNGWVFSGLADGYVTANWNHPSPINNQLQNFNMNYGQAELSLIKFTIDKSDKVLGIHLDTGFGETMRQIHAADIAAQEHQALRYFEQMYVIFKPNHMHGTEIDFGQFVTSAGAEVIESTSNWNYTRSLLFALAIPYYHMGFRMNVPVTKVWTLGVQEVNAWNTMWGNNDFKNAGITSTLTMPKYTWSVNWYVGPNHAGTTAGVRNLLDSTVLLTPNSKFNVYINGDYGRDNHSVGGGYDDWYGLAGAGVWHLNGHFSIAGRAEFYDDKTGFNTGTKQVLKEGTLTGEYKYNDHLISRIEYRHDASDQPYFNQRAGQPLSKDMNTFTLGIMAILGPLK